MIQNLRVAVVGTGFFSGFHLEGWSRLDTAELVALCSHDGETLRLAAGKYSIKHTYRDVEQMLDELSPDLLDIVTPPHTHRAIIELAVSRNIPVICQKPFTGSVIDAEIVASLSRRTGVLVVVHENFRFQPWYRKIKELLDSGRYGDIYQLTFRLRPGDGQGPSAYLDRQPYFQTMERFLIHETAIHFIDVFRFLLGETERVFARLQKLNPVITGEDAGLIVMEFGNRTRALIDANRLSDHVAENRRLTMGELLLEMEKATVRLDGDGRIFLRPFGGNSETEIVYDWADTGFGGDCVFHLQAHVVDHLLYDTPVMNTAEDYLANLYIEEAVYKSDEEERFVSINE
jgi:D-apiose dehydrogenase